MFNSKYHQVATNHWALRYRPCSSTLSAVRSTGNTTPNPNKRLACRRPENDAIGRVAKCSAAPRCSMAWCTCAATAKTTTTGRRWAIQAGAMKRCCRSSQSPRITSRSPRWTAITMRPAVWCLCPSSIIIRQCRMRFCAVDKNWVGWNGI